MFNQELRFPVYKIVPGGAFWDVGNVFARARDFQFGELHHSAGAGVPLVFPFGAVRLDWARVLDRRPGEAASRWHFSFGYAF